MNEDRLFLAIKALVDNDAAFKLVQVEEKSTLGTIVGKELIADMRIPNGKYIIVSLPSWEDGWRLDNFLRDTFSLSWLIDNAKCAESKISHDKYYIISTERYGFNVKV